MFKGFEKNDNAVASAAAMAQPERSAVDRHAATPVSTPVSCIGSGMSIVGNVECSGAAQVFGRIEGELRATELLIGEGAQVEGSIQAEQVTISGRVKGTIRAIRVSLLRATVEGDIFHRSLSVDESSVFEGGSRRVENPVERRADNTAGSSSSATGKATKKAVQTLPLVSSAVPATNGASQP
jgi:cytoskeletal protein CcmA (bactofilin family)